MNEQDVMMDDKLILATPKTLEEAIANGLLASGDTPSAKVIRTHVRDYLAQHFAAAMLQTAPDTEPEFMRLFDRIVFGKKGR